ncbi:MAG: endonuclease domain-containing protein [Deltaproteobacteria bacterium]|nr:endonuclease domain-containing protein [Deltaproteobacteria bacterium]
MTDVPTDATLDEPKEKLKFYLYHKSHTRQNFIVLAPLVDPKTIWVECPVLSLTAGYWTVSQALASRALEIWPNWFNGSYSAELVRLTETEEPKVKPLTALAPKIDLKWLTQAALLAKSGQAPSVDDEATPMGEVWRLAQLLGSELTVLALEATSESDTLEALGWKQAILAINRLLSAEIAVFCPRAYLEDSRLKPLFNKATVLSTKRRDLRARLATPLSPPPPRQTPPNQTSPSQSTPSQPSPKPDLATYKLQLTEKLLEDPRVKGLFRANVFLGYFNRGPLMADLFGPGQLAVFLSPSSATIEAATIAAENDLNRRLFGQGLRVVRFLDVELAEGLDAVVKKLVALTFKRGPGTRGLKFVSQGPFNELDAAAYNLAQTLNKRVGLKKRIFRERYASLDHKNTLVDFVWPEGALVIVIDKGPQIRSLEERLRELKEDYLMTLGGYTVVRVSRSELLGSPEKAVNQIARIVELKKAKLQSFTI